MRSECAQAVVQALGRSLTKAELDGIESRMVRALRNTARQDPVAWQAKPQAEKLQEAAKVASAELIGEHELKQRRAALQIAAHSKFAQYLSDQAARGINGFDAMDRAIGFHADLKSNYVSMEKQAEAIEKIALSQMLRTLEASNPKFFGLFENQQGIESLVREIFGQSSGNAEAKAGAKLWHEVTSTLRERFNRAGGDIGQLEDWGLPHHHSQSKVADVGREQWVKDTLPLIDREHYFNPDGSRMSDEQVNDFLGNAWTTIATGGANKLEPGTFSGSGSRANRGSESRQIHFKDADSYMQYQAKYGEKSLYEVLLHHIEGISKDIALTEAFGPNPDATFRSFRDEIIRRESTADPRQTQKIQERAIRTENLYNVVSGKTTPVASRALAESFDTLRNWLIASRLGSSIITSFSDEATLHQTAHLNQIPEMRLLRNEFASMNPLNRMEERMARRAGLSLNTLKASLNRFGQQGLGRGFSSKLANTVLRVSGLNAITEARKRAFSASMMGALGSVAKEHDTLAAIDKHDYQVLHSKGISEDDFALWKRADLEDWGSGNTTQLTPESIYRIPDAKVDEVIGPRIQKLKDDANEQIKGLNERNTQDVKWATNRADKLTDWVKREIAKVESRIEKTKAEGSDKLKDISGKLSKLQERLEFAASIWKKPEGDVPGIDTQQKVGFYGRAKLRSLGVDEGRAREAIRQVESQAREVKASIDRFSKDATEKLFEDFDRRQAELKEFTDSANERIAKRQQVIDRINRDIDPAIQGERMKAREQAATKLLGAILEEQDTAIIEPGAKERSITGGGLQRGTWRGELTRSFFLFKSFPMAMIYRHWARGMALPTRGGRGAYIAALIATTTLFGALSLEVNEILSGRDPKNLNPGEKGGWKNLIQAMLKGGSLGIYGDFLFSDTTQYGNSPLASATGPVLSSAEDLFNLGQGNLVKAAQNKKTNVGAELVRFVKSNTPGASLWYLKAAFDHLIWNQLQEYVNPGYLSRMRARAQTEFNQRYYWEPQDVAPSRAPDPGAVWH